MSRRKAGLSPSLFPFLAVLVCTLGTLILLLALVAQEAKDAAVARAKQVQQPKSVSTSAPERIGTPELTLQAATRLVEEEQFRRQQLVSFRDAQTQDAETKRDEVAVLEAAIRDLKTRLESLKDEIETATSDLDPAEAMKVDASTLVMMQEEITKLRADIKELESNERGKKPRVVIVPHRGPNGTQRRPIYVECTADEIRIMPEGARITKTQALAAAEARNPNANPLGSALRVARRHAMQAYGDQVAPYPLLIVRPGGIRMFHIASALMKDWDDQYGYELVPGEVDLAFPGGDRVLRKDLEYAIHEASSRNFMFARGVGGGGRSGGNGKGSSDGLPTMRPSTSGPGDSGVVSGYGQTTPGANAVARSEPIQPLPVLSAKSLDQQALSNGFTPARDQRFANAFGTTPQTSGGAFGANRELNSQSDALNDFLQGRTSADLDSGSGQSGSGQNGTEQSGSTQNGTEQDPTEVASADSSSDTETSGEVDRATSDGRVAGATQSSPGGTQKMAQQLASNASTTATPPANSATANSPPPSASPSSGSPAGESSSQPPPPTDPTSPSNPSVTMSSNQNQVRRDGRDWAMPEAFRGMGGTEVVRPISMICHHDRYELLDQGRVVATFPFHRGDVYQSTIQLATAVRDRVAGWGATLPGGRWQPRLDVQVGPHAEQRFHELETLMKGSGVEINRRTP